MGSVFGILRPFLDGGAGLAGEGVLVQPGTVPLVGAQVAARAAVLAQGEVVAVQHIYGFVVVTRAAGGGGKGCGDREDCGHV